MRGTRWIVLVVSLLVAAWWPAAAADGGFTWARVRCEVVPSPGVPAVAYTLVENVSRGPKHRVRVLFTAPDGTPLVAEILVKERKGGGSRWFSFAPVPGRPVIDFAVTGNVVEVHGNGGKLVATFEMGPAEARMTGRAREALDALAGSLPEKLTTALEAFARVGLGREPTFYEEARILRAALFPWLTPPPLDETKRREVLHVVDWDPAKYPPLPGEKKFGRLYDWPLRERSAPRPASATRPAAPPEGGR